ncbi:hypothetical protein CC78DRAFT_570284 [Lojkania enalia]|uniref:Zn(2)-C6 fungal-type domain-containing protein n=1 Tax=Lojkania enalia TaxID=147567 RepID=A0A9P4K465_9PLEO|nr:hypothetical protein CC78DRAFT_570284 [Didymosphaeria enalia]
MLVSRKSHRKTRLGCKPCKTRRIKCDERRPSCANCTKRGLDCSFLSVDPAWRISNSSSSSQHQKNSGLESSFKIHVFHQCSPKSVYPTFPSSLLDPSTFQALVQGFPGLVQPRFKMLLHHFVINTSSSISFNDSGRMAWLIAVPQLVETHRFVLHGVLAVTALHISRSLRSETEKRGYLSIAAGQLNTGLSRYRVALQDISKRNADALFAFSTLMTAYLLALASDDCVVALSSIKRKHLSTDQMQYIVEEAISQNTKILRFLRSTLVIVVPCWKTICRGLLSPLANRDWWPTIRYPATPRALEEDRRLHALECMWMEDERKFEYYFETLESALKYLRECFALVSQLSVPSDTASKNTGLGTIIDMSAVFVWPFKTSIEFITLLEQRQPEAWVILAHYAILPGRIGKLWWLDSMASNMVETAAIVLGEDKWGLLEWPASVVGVNLDDLRSSSVG